MKNWILKHFKRVKELEKDASYYKKLYNKYYDLNESLSKKFEKVTNDNINLRSEIENQKLKYEERIEKIQMELDILYKYYDLGKEPTQQERTQIRIDKHVHDLELQNIELRCRIETYLYSEMNRLKNLRVEAENRMMYPFAYHYPC